MLRFTGALIFVAVLAGQTPDRETGLPPESLLLARIRVHMSDNLQRQPNYTCLETVERTRRPKGSRAQVVDTLRLEVALVNGKELFAWPGAKKFEDKEISDIVATGTFGNGNFAIFARAVFMGSIPAFVHRGRETVNGKSAVRYDFRVATARSNYIIRVNAREATVGYHGSFWADSDTFDVQRLEIFADDIPKYFGVDAAYDRMDYTRLPIGGQDFLLPSESVLEMKAEDGESRNFMRFTNCRQYTGESVVKFTEEVTEDGVILPAALPPATPAIAEVELPKGVQLTMALTEALDLNRLAVGDAITAEIRSDVKVKREVIVPKLAIVRGRITRLERHADHTVLGVAFTDIDWAEKHAALAGSLEQALGIRTNSADMRRLPIYAPHPGEGIVLLPAAQKQLIRGMLFYWRTDP